MVLGITFFAVCLLYSSTLLIGWHLAKRGRLDVARVVASQRRFTDPITARFQQWCQRRKFYTVVAAAVLLGAWLEVRMLRSHLPEGLDVPSDFSREEMRAKMVDMLKRQSGGAA